MEPQIRMGIQCSTTKMKFLMNCVYSVDYSFCLQWRKETGKEKSSKSTNNQKSISIELDWLDGTTCRRIQYIGLNRVPIGTKLKSNQIKSKVIKRGKPDESENEKENGKNEIVLY